MCIASNLYASATTVWISSLITGSYEIMITFTVMSNYNYSVCGWLAVYTRTATLSESGSVVVEFSVLV